MSTRTLTSSCASTMVRFVNSDGLALTHVGNKYVLFVLCFANEALFLIPYFLYYEKTLPVWVNVQLVKTAYTVLAPLGIVKQFMNFVQVHYYSILTTSYYH